MKTIQCLTCNKKINLSKKDIKIGKKYCNRKCYLVHHKHKVRCCVVCGSFHFKYTKTCSKKCGGDLISKNKTKAIKKPDCYGYICLSFKGKQIREHRYIWEQAHGALMPGWVVHHKNHNRLDNRIENLEAMPRGHHQTLHKDEIKKGVNKRGQKFLSNLRRAEGKRSHWRGKTHTSKYKGVNKHGQLKNKWIARITVLPGKRLHIGLFNTQKEAALAYNKAAKIHFGKTGYLNKVKE